MKFTLFFIIGVLAILCAKQHYETNAVPAVVFSTVPLGTVIGNRFGWIRKTTRGPTTVISTAPTEAATTVAPTEAATTVAPTEAATTVAQATAAAET